MTAPFDHSRTARTWPVAWAVVLALVGHQQLAKAAGTDISNTPLAQVTTAVKPNIMFILDDSGSMASEYMPDDMSWPGYYGYYSAQCNGLAFNPNTTYTPPLKADGTSYPNSSFSSAPDDGYNSSSSTTNLGDDTGIVNASYSGWWGTSYTYGYRQYYLYTGSQSVMNWTYSSSGSVNTGTTFYSECNSSIGSTPGSGVFTKYLIKDQSAETKQNYANWYSYYRSRLLTMRTASGRAFAALDSNYRVGFTMISDSTVSSSDFLNVADFDSTQKTAFFSKLYSSYSGSWTPLRGALSKVGRYYANRISGQTDPVQYSCQRNYALLSTDGYWNNQIETTSYGPYKLDGSTEVGEQDGATALVNGVSTAVLRPMRDSSTTVVTTVTTSGSTVRTSTDAPVTTTNTRYQVSAASNNSGCSSGGWFGWGATYNTTVTTQTCTSNWTRTTVTDTTTTTTSTTVTTNGVAGTPTSSTTTSSSTVSQTSRPSCSSWSNTGTSSQCRSSSYLSSNYGISPGGSTTTASTPSDSVGSGTTSTVSTTPFGPTSTETTTSTNGDSNTLADVAHYYWATDLRSDHTNNVPTNTNDNATHQHMNTFTLGLGVRGTLSYDSNYQTQTSGDFAAIKAGTKDWPVPVGTTSSGSTNATHIDDLWHAAVNGRGQYFSALDPTAVSSAISSALSTIKSETGTAAAAAASSLTPTTGDDWIFLPSYTTLTWTGDLRAFKYTFSNGKAIPPSDTSAGKELWSVKSKLDARTYTGRTLYFNQNGALGTFSYSNLSAAQKAYFDNRCTTATELLSQCSAINSTAKAKVTGTNLVNYLAGDKELYRSSASADNQVFRTRANILGDIVNAAPVYVGKPPFQYTDSGYASFVSAQASRTKVVYVAANDGMLHAFKVADDASGGGTELWAYVPSAVMPNLWRLASDGYTGDHRYFVDSTPVVSDVYDSANSRWRTILVGGLGGGGRGYYALDITTPESPTLLWEIDNNTKDASNVYQFPNLGLSYGNPIVTKLKNGTWVVAFTSGLNNHTNGGNGDGHLYIVKAMTGEKLRELTTNGTGNTTTPNNLGRLDGWVDSSSNNTVTRFYAGDMLGNLWRFDHDDNIAPSGNETFLLGKTRTSSGTAQPITVKPLLMSLTSSGREVPVVVFGTGRYIGSTDLTDTLTQTIYAVKDSLGTTGLDVLRDGTDALVQQTLNSSRTISSPATINWATQNGWFIDLNVTASSGERIFIDPIALSAETLQFASGIVTGSNACTVAGTSWIYQLNLSNGNVSTVALSGDLVVGQSALVNSDGTTTSLVDDVRGKLFTTNNVNASSSGSSLKRATWRELIN